MRMKFGILLCALSLSAAAFAEIVYVDDTLRVGVRPEPVSGGPTVAVVTTGTRLEVLERRGSQMHVRTPNGVEGWVKSAYMSSAKPASALLKEANETVKQLQAQLAEMRNQPRVADNGDAIKQLQQKIAQLEEKNGALRKALESRPAQGQRPTENLKMNRIIKELDLNHAYWLGSIIFFLALGFLFGVSWYKNQVSKRLGGFTL